MTFSKYVVIVILAMVLTTCAEPKPFKPATTQIYQDDDVKCVIAAVPGNLVMECKWWN